MRLTIFYSLLACFLAGGCSDGGGDNGADPSANRPFEELYRQGVDRYLGIFTPMTSAPTDAGAVLHSFGGGDGPLCYTGKPFSMSTRDGESDELLIFLQGGGACSANNCAAVDVAWPIINFGILSASDAANPAVDFDLGYVPYCDGTLFSGDRDADSNGDGSNDRFFRGVQNLSASLDVIANTYPTPSRIVLAGNSAGGFGTHYALPLVRQLYPEVPIDLINDSGVGISQPGSQESLRDYWNSDPVLPASCTTCIGEDGNLTDYHKYQLDEDANLRMGFISSTGDEVIVPTPEDRAVFGAQVIEAVAELEAAHPERFRSLISDSEEHTYIIKQFGFGIGGTTVRQWVSDMLSGSDDWVSKSD